MTNAVQELIEEAAKMISSPGIMCGGALAFNAKGRPCCPTAAGAQRWCPIGALYKVARVPPAKPDRMPNELAAALTAVQLMSTKYFGCSIEILADIGRNQDVLQAMRRAWVMAGAMSLAERRK